MVGDEEDAGVSHVALLCLLAAFAVPPVALAWFRAAGGEASATVLAGVVLAPLAAIALALGILARKVGSKADDPEAVGPRVAEGLGASMDSFEEQFED